MTEQEKNITNSEEDELELDDLEIDDSDDDSEDLTVDDYKKEKNRRMKAEKTLVEQKKRIKELEQNQKKEQDGYVTKEDLEILRFLDKNPELAEYRDDLEKYVKKGLTLKEAKTLVENSDKTIEARKKLESTRFTDGENPTRTSVTKKELENMSEIEYNRVMKQVDAGKIKIK